MSCRGAVRGGKGRRSRGRGEHGSAGGKRQEGELVSWWVGNGLGRQERPEAVQLTHQLTNSPPHGAREAPRLNDTAPSPNPCTSLPPRARTANRSSWREASA